MNKNQLHDYWKNPDASNQPLQYTKPVIRSQFLYKYVHSICDENAKVLELGCNVGRNLNYLFERGYKNLSAVEISRNAVDLMKQFYPQLVNELNIYNNSIENQIKQLDSNEFDLIYTMAVLEHIHPDSEWIFTEMARITNSYLITVEDEMHSTLRHFPRNYQKVFEPLGLKQILEAPCLDAGLDESFVIRIFKKDK